MRSTVTNDQPIFYPQSRSMRSARTSSILASSGLPHRALHHRFEVWDSNSRHATCNPVCHLCLLAEWNDNKKDIERLKKNEKISYEKGRVDEDNWRNIRMELLLSNFSSVQRYFRRIPSIDPSHINGETLVHVSKRNAVIHMPSCHIGKKLKRTMKFQQAMDVFWNGRLPAGKGGCCLKHFLVCLKLEFLDEYMKWS